MLGPLGKAPSVLDTEIKPVMIGQSFSNQFSYFITLPVPSFLQRPEVNLADRNLL